MHSVEQTANADEGVCCVNMETEDCCYDKTEYFQLKTDFLKPAVLGRSKAVNSNITFKKNNTDVLSSVRKYKQEKFISQYIPTERSTRLSLLMSFLI